MRSKRRLTHLPVEEDVRRELEAHLAMSADELVREGWSPEEARAEAARRFGDIGRVRKKCQTISKRHHTSQERKTFMETVWQDVKFGFRSLLRSPAFAITALVTLAIGIGANAAIFSLVNGVLLRPLPYPDPDRIVQVHELTARGIENAVAHANFADWRSAAGSFTALAAYGQGAASVLGADEALRGDYAIVSKDFFDVMGVHPATGRAFLPEEQRIGGDPAAIVSHRFWTTWMGSTTDFARRTLEAAGGRYRVVGIMPAGFDFPLGTDLWVPMELAEQTPHRTAHNYRVVGRLREGTSVISADAELDRITADLAAQYAEINAASASVVPLRDQLARPLRRSLVLLFAAAGFVLLIACTNIASSLLARATGREHEVAVRMALGAGRARMARQLFTESLVLTILGGALGFGTSMVVLRGLSAVAPAGMFDAWTVTADPWVLAFTFALSVLTAAAFSLLPTLRLDGAHAERLGKGSRGNAPRSSRAWSVLVAVEITLTATLLVGSGLLIRSFWQVLSQESGFEPAQVLTVRVTLPGSEYPVLSPGGRERPLVGHDHSAPARYHDELLRRVRALPGVRLAAIANYVPLSVRYLNGAFEIEGRASEDGGSANYRIVSPQYFAALEIPVLRGRGIDDQDAESSMDVVVVNQALADRFYPGEDPIGKRIRTGGMDIHFEEWTTIVGVVGNVRQQGLERPPQPEYYLSHRQRADRTTAATLVIKADRSETALIPAVRNTIRELDSNVPIEFATMEQRVASSVADRRFSVIVLGTFAGVALLLSLIGIYGVVSYWISRRARELGIRMAVGAKPSTVLWSVLSRSLAAVGVGAAFGVLGAFAVARLLASMLYEVSTADPLVFVLVPLGLLATALLASYVPARRVTRIDPVVVLRSE